MPDHLHAIWPLPENDIDYSTRWAPIKAGFSRAIPKTERIRESRERKGECGVWQRRFWEHLIRDDSDLQRHVGYTHYNPVEHGCVPRAADWLSSPIHLYAQMGWVPTVWGYEDDGDGDFGERP
jgi:putative transposase